MRMPEGIWFAKRRWPSDIRVYEEGLCFGMSTLVAQRCSRISEAKTVQLQTTSWDGSDRV